MGHPAYSVAVCFDCLGLGLWSAGGNALVRFAVFKGSEGPWSLTWASFARMTAGVVVSA